MRKLLLVIVLAVVVIGVGGYAATNLLPESNPINEAVSDAQAGAVNAVLDASGAKGAVQDALDANVGTIANALGVTVGDATAIVDNLAVESWTATTLPSTVTATSVVDGSSLGIDGTVTLYDDPNYATIDAYGQTITFEVPDSAQQYLPYLAWL